MSGWLTSWKTSATLAVLGVAYLAWGLLLRTTTNWNMVFTGASVAVGSGVLAVILHRASSTRG